jgi:hypothetical protein
MLMPPLSASSLLETWERAAGRAPVEQALAILGAAFPGEPADGLTRLSIGQRDACLLELRRLTFGSQLMGLVACPACSERLEMSFDIDDLWPAGLAKPEPGTLPSAQAEASFSLAPYEVTFRLPTSADLGVLTRLDDPDLAQKQLLKACVLNARCDEKEVPVGDLPEDILTAVTERMNQADPLADLTLAATCPACGHRWQVLFDIASFFWSEINAWAVRLMYEVHVLASAYGWREADILAMSAWRRQGYLELIGV